ncbi:hypothetical protein [Mammaliicoccus fleurettii]|uniref:hypothetical protein n=1 Tax=Mammaliicoccus fleurettii TaxID=150056 RepID=UPI001AAD684E|nr:hypothetical protein [Mammaliicoccus fleurettii]MBO3062709.1 hypothetical protein [Mammaliicoccus fleurettii]
MKIVYLLDGTPFMAELNDEGEYTYPNDEWTEVPPPEGIYQPFYYDGNEWIGSTREEWESNQEELPTQPNEIEELKQRIIELENKVQELTQGTD